MSKDLSDDIKSLGSDNVGLRPLREGSTTKRQADRPLSTVLDVDEDQRLASVDSWPLRQSNRSFVDLEHGKVFHAY